MKWGWWIQRSAHSDPLPSSTATPEGQDHRDLAVCCQPSPQEHCRCLGGHLWPHPYLDPLFSHLCFPASSDLCSPCLPGLFLLFLQICQMPRILSLSIYYCLLPMMLRNVLSQLHRAHSYYLFLLPAAVACTYTK